MSADSSHLTCANLSRHAGSAINLTTEFCETIGPCTSIAIRINGGNFLNNHLIEKVVDLLSLGLDELLSLSQGNSCSVASVDIFIPPHRVLSEFELIE